MSAWAADQAERWLRETDRNNGGSGIGCVFSQPVRLDAALGLLQRADRIELRTDRKFPVLDVNVPGHGLHRWYLNLMRPAADPWS